MKELSVEQREHFVHELKLLQNSRDTEHAHGRADQILIDILYHLGEHKVITNYQRIKKWYA